MACLLLHLGVSSFHPMLFISCYCYRYLLKCQNFCKFVVLMFILVTEQKEKLSELEQQLKRAEALQRRRMQVEKAARESEV